MARSGQPGIRRRGRGPRRRGEAQGQARNDHSRDRHLLAPGLPWPLLLAEFIGTALLVGVGLSIVILDFGRHSPVASLVPSPALRRAITGFAFGCVGAAITISPVGKTSGSHINPVVTLSFALEHKLSPRLATGYVVAQLLGATLGAGFLLAWGAMGDSIDYGASLPGKEGTVIAALGEAGATFLLVFLLFTMLGIRPLKRFAPLLFPPLYGVLVWLEGPLSGTSTNPARSLGPEIVTPDFHGWWVYWIGPVSGAVVAMALRRFSPASRLQIDEAKLAHFLHDPFDVLHDRR